MLGAAAGHNHPVLPEAISFEKVLALLLFLLLTEHSIVRLSITSLLPLFRRELSYRVSCIVRTANHTARQATKIYRVMQPDPYMCACALAGACY